MDKALYKVGDRVEYDFEEYEVVDVSLDERYWYNYTLLPIPEPIYAIQEDEIDGIVI